jgi:hypothetical protein
MTTSIQIIDPVVDNRWDAYIEGADGSSIFHHSCWKRVIEETFHAQPLYLAACDGAAGILGAMPFFLTRGILTGKALVSLPFSDYCDVLAREADEFGALWGRALDWGREKGARYVEIRTRDRGGIDLASYALEKRKTYLNHFLKITGDIAFMEKRVIEKSYKYDIRQAARNGVVVRTGMGEPDMRQYYRLYVMTRCRQGLPPVPYAFFKNVWEVLSPAKMAYLFLAYWLDRPIAGIVLLRHKNCLYALSASSDRAFLDKKPNHLLWWRGIQLAVELGLEGLDFGRTSPENKGLRFFKTRWGAEEIGISHYRLEMKGKNGNGRGRACLEKALPLVLKKIPFRALGVIGKIAYRYM